LKVFISANSAKSAGKINYPASQEVCPRITLRAQIFLPGITQIFTDDIAADSQRTRDIAADSQIFK
jgi:hypothetical protein